MIALVAVRVPSCLKWTSMARQSYSFPCFLSASIFVNDPAHMQRRDVTRLALSVRMQDNVGQSVYTCLCVHVQMCVQQTGGSVGALLCVIRPLSSEGPCFASGIIMFSPRGATSELKLRNACTLCRRLLRQQKGVRIPYAQYTRLISQRNR